MSCCKEKGPSPLREKALSRLFIDDLSDILQFDGNGAVGIVDKLDIVRVFDVFRRENDFNARVGLDLVAAAGPFGKGLGDRHVGRQLGFFQLGGKFIPHGLRTGEYLCPQVLRRKGFGRLGVFDKVILGLRQDLYRISAVILGDLGGNLADQLDSVLGRNDRRTLQEPFRQDIDVFPSICRFLSTKRMEKSPQCMRA